MKDRTAGDVVAEWMVDSGIRRFFHVPGETFIPILNGLGDRPEVQIVTMRHESSASFAAEAVGKLRGRAAVCMATRGPGSSNLALGLQTAYYDATPVIALTTTVPRPEQDSGSFQAYEPRSMFGGTTKAVLTVTNTSALSATLDQASAIAHSGRPGPVVVALPTDLLREEIPEPASFTQHSVTFPGSSAPQSLIDSLATAQRPIIIVATRCIPQAAVDQFARMCEASGLPVATAWRRFSAYPNDSPSYVGGIGVGGPPATIRALKEADLVVVLGFGVESLTTNGPGKLSSGTRLVQITEAVDERALRLAGDSARVESLVAPPEQIMAKLAEWAAQNPEWSAGVAEKNAQSTRRLRDEYRASLQSASGSVSVGVPQGEIFKALERAIPDNAIITSDAGNFARWMQRHMTFGGGRTFLAPVNGAMGYGLPSAIAANLEEPGRPVWCIAGDGGYLMTGGEMETATRLGLNVVSVVINNNSYGSIRRDQELKYPGEEPVGTLLGHVDFTAVAAGHGWSGIQVTEPAELPDALVQFGSMSGNRILEISADPYELSV